MTQNLGFYQELDMYLSFVYTRVLLYFIFGCRNWTSQIVGWYIWTQIRLQWHHSRNYGISAIIWTGPRWLVRRGRTWVRIPTQWAHRNMYRMFSHWVSSFASRSELEKRTTHLEHDFHPNQGSNPSLMLGTFSTLHALTHWATGGLVASYI